jgi:hypothetical protein
VAVRRGDLLCGARLADVALDPLLWQENGHAEVIRLRLLRLVVGALEEAGLRTEWGRKTVT